MNKKGLISVVIPCYNAERFIVETISSIINQTYPNLEIIVIDDGSTDNSKAKIQELRIKNLQYIHQVNQGVSTTRNNGLKIAKGEYILFLDADDIISPNFIINRFNYLEAHSEYGACTSTIEIINKNGEKQNKHYKNIYKIEDLTSFNPSSFTCPSGYLFRNKTLRKNKLSFDLQLSSSADKYFLYQFFKHSKIGYIESSPLLYRVYSQSMSNNLSEKLIQDHINYLNLIIEKNVIPKTEKKSVTARINYTVGASYFHLKRRKKAVYFLLKSMFISPKTIINLIAKREENGKT